jgi:hypothetical protein
MAPSPESPTASSTAALVRQLAERYHVRYVPTQADALANQLTRLSSDSVRLDDIECLLIALQRAGHITRDQLIQLQVSYLREVRS